MVSKYQIGIAGDPNDKRRKLEETFFRRIEELGIDPDQIVFLDEADIGAADPKSPIVVVFFGYWGASDAKHTVLKSLLEDSSTIVPCVDKDVGVGNSLPPSICHINAFRMEGDYERLATLVLENLRLLRSERRLFISYKRSESQSVAIQLYEKLDEAGFDVFLDTRSVPYAVDFQGVLLHRMADSDIVVLLDSPQFRTSRWTQLELAHANATSIQILHILWPEVSPELPSAFSEFLQLKDEDFQNSDRVGDNARLANNIAEAIIQQVESLRARALAARHRSLVDNFCDRARDENVEAVVQPERFISVDLGKGNKVAVIPTIGVPRADRYQDLSDAIRKVAPDAKDIWLLYDERGLLEKWLAHLEWLNNHLPVTSVQVSHCTDRLRNS